MTYVGCDGEEINDLRWLRWGRDREMTYVGCNGEDREMTYVGCDGEEIEK